MPRCKMSGCNEEAVPLGKRYCPTHKAAYEAKRREYDRVQATLPECIGGCGKKVGPHRVQQGLTYCLDCENEARDRMQRQALYDAQVRHIEGFKTLDDVKQYLISKLEIPE